MKTRLAIVVLVLSWLGGGAPFVSGQILRSDFGAKPQARGVGAAPQSPNPAELDLEQLANMDVQVTSASKKEESLLHAPAAIYVITREDIERSGFSSLPEVLRMVPGLTVSQMSAHSWSISARGFNGFPNEKMLVLIDGRSVYHPLYGGVNWDVQSVVLQDVDRIEVIRGPGGTLWGANAINGVINVITRSAEHTQGLLLATSSGHDEGYQGTGRLGGQIGHRFFYRVFGQSSYWDPFVTASGDRMFNDWNLSQGGFRIDDNLSLQDSLSVAGAGYQGHIRDTAAVTTYTSNETVQDPYSVAGGHILGAWKHRFSERSATSATAYCDWSDRREIQYGAEFRDTCDLDFQHDFSFNDRNAVIWGAGVRSSGDSTRVSFRNAFTPPERRLNLFSVFGQYEMVVVPDRVRVIVGSKFEHNSFTGFEIQPQIRAVWTPAKRHAVWGAVSRAVRTPTRNEHDNYLVFSNTPLGPPPAPPMIMAFVGNPHIKSETLMAYELGYRYQRAQKFWFDASIFYNSYGDLIYPNFNGSPAVFHPVPPYVLLAFPFVNAEKAQTHGLELSASWRTTSFWQVTAGVTEDRGTGWSMQATPKHQFTLQSRLDLPKRFQFDCALYHHNAIRSVFGGGQALAVPTFNRVDAGLSWQLAQGLKLGLWGRNLQSDHHPENIAPFTSSGEVPRAVVVKAEWEFTPETRRTK